MLIIKYNTNTDIISSQCQFQNNSGPDDSQGVGLRRTYAEKRNQRCNAGSDGKTGICLWDGLILNLAIQDHVKMYCNRHI